MKRSIPLTPLLNRFVRHVCLVSFSLIFDLEIFVNSPRRLFNCSVTYLFVYLLYLRIYLFILFYFILFIYLEIATKSHYKAVVQGPVVRRPISTYPRVKFTPNFFFFRSKEFSLLFLRASNHQLVDKKN